MPFYEYACRKCGHHHEALQKLSDPPLRKCPECGKASLQRLMSAPVFRLKGGGWYETDFKSDAEGKRNLHGEQHDAVAGGETKDAAKPEVKADATPAESKPAESKPAEPKPAPAATPVAKAAPKPRTSRRAAARKPMARKR